MGCRGAAASPVSHWSGAKASQSSSNRGAKAKKSHRHRFRRRRHVQWGASREVRRRAVIGRQAQRRRGNERTPRHADTPAGRHGG
eukprot:NODE_6345_length_514_cov_193.967320.p2 GENE.NODE_6345_length_514_cov_193.967320~~NODE_6345_length_514_cov_193.967320.p2  ORF type:complete len:85 (+),score=5.58 NODE_6345_length_514_cov_193.967320:138-392(+)